ncbi:MAG: 3-deoxy-7-phosphoheptulonate synthase, partial [Methyloligellaceae bacterium]
MAFHKTGHWGYNSLYNLNFLQFRPSFGRVYRVQVKPVKFRDTRNFLQVFEFQELGFMANTWSPSSWRSLPIVQVPEYGDDAKLQEVEKQLSNYPPLVFA